MPAHGTILMSWPASDPRLTPEPPSSLPRNLPAYYCFSRFNSTSIEYYAYARDANKTGGREKGVGVAAVWLGPGGTGCPLAFPLRCLAEPRPCPPAPAPSPLPRPAPLTLVPPAAPCNGMQPSR